MQRLSVAVVVNYLGTDKDGKPQPMSKEQLAQIEALVREAMGYSSSRGDTLNVVNTPFTDSQVTGGELPFWQSQSFIDRLLDAGRYLLVLLVAWLLWRKLVRPQLQQRQRRNRPPPPPPTPLPPNRSTAANRATRSWRSVVNRSSASAQKSRASGSAIWLTKTHAWSLW